MRKMTKHKKMRKNDDEQNHTQMRMMRQENEDQKDKNKDEETEVSLDSDYDIDDYKLDEQLVDTDSDKQSNEKVIQKKINELNIEYKIFTNQFDEITKAENLENSR